MIIRAFVFFILAVVSGGASAQAPAFDMADVIRVSAAKHAATQKVDAGSAVKRMDDLLVRDYGARGRIASERDPRLKSLYTQAARLLMNGNAISGGTMVVIASQEPGFSGSPVGPALQAFIGAMLMPADEEDMVLVEFTERANKARAKLGALRLELQMAAQLRVMGAIYHDPIAVDAGVVALKKLSASAAEEGAVAAALTAAGAK
ncbi:hypothetical protein N7359_01395 [Stenotrophomonas maltophilia]|uniref:hypothetical protein n=1 Tax=Stenotrophomonas maltophilia TaxID=40324 RepID=UPI002449A38F|nr:hypothetical protein [Stenotrophomonas maltophilia]MDH0071195.1 hypothetical protein [Stenotrophomonas maltophilia]MDH0104079.1 hypothetical protein [Stenotrophomonas maltophilia]MDH0330142.1 hypothetical protein [Stenotrophomonas maltophilia]